MFTTDVGLPQAQVCYICQRYGRRKNHKTEMNSVLKISYFVAGIFTRNNTGLRMVYNVVSDVDNELDLDQLYKR